MSYTHLEKIFNDRIEEDSIMCTDSLSSYKTYANKNGVSLEQIKNGKFKEGISHPEHQRLTQQSKKLDTEIQRCINKVFSQLSVLV